MSLSKAQELRKQYGKLVADAQAVIDKDELSAEDRTKFDQMITEADKIKAQFEQIEADEDRKVAAAERVRELERSQGRRIIETPGGETTDDAAIEREAFTSWLRNGAHALSPEQRAVMQRRIANLSPDQRALAAGTAASGGYTVAGEFFNKLVEAQLTFSGMRQVGSTILTTETGATLSMPTENDTSNSGAIVGENAQASSADPTFGQVQLSAYLYSSKYVQIPIQLLQDSAFDVESYIARKLGIRIGRATNSHFTTGDGSSKPSGVITGATSGVTAASATAVTTDELMDLEHSVDPAYRQNGKWMLKDATLKALKKLKDGDGRYLWVPGIAVRQPDTILGYPWVVNTDMNAMTTGLKPIAFGDFSYYFIRDVRDVTLMRLVERFADYHQVAFLAFSRHDGALVDAGTNPVKFITMA